MKGLTILILAALLASAGMAAPGDPEPLYEYAADYTYYSRVDNGNYWWAFRNERTDATMTGCTTGAGFPIGTIPRAAIIPEATFPLPAVQPTLPRPWFNAFLDGGPLNPLVVMATMRWSDNRTAQVPVYMPPDAPLLALQAVPEPSGMLALGMGLVGMVGMAWKRRR